MKWKRNNIIGAILLVLSLFYAGTSLSSENQVNTIRWEHAYFPPVTIPYGENKGGGFYDKITHFVIDQMSQYSHSFELSNYRRTLLNIKNKENVCCASLYKTPEREKFITFSVPAVVVLPNGVIIRKEDASEFSSFLNESGELKLKEILASQNLTLGIADGRIYSGGIDSYLKSAVSKNIVKRSGSDVFDGLFQMLLAKRVDCILGYPTEASYIGRLHNESDSYLFYPLAEVEISYTLGHFGCPDNEWGRRIIKDVNSILLTYRSSFGFLEYYRVWLDSKTAASYDAMAVEVLATE